MTTPSSINVHSEKIRKSAVRKSGASDSYSFKPTQSTVYAHNVCINRSNLCAPVKCVMRCRALLAQA